MPFQQPNRSLTPVGPGVGLCRRAGPTRCNPAALYGHPAGRGVEGRFRIRHSTPSDTEGGQAARSRLTTLADAENISCLTGGEGRRPGRGSCGTYWRGGPPAVDRPHSQTAVDAPPRPEALGQIHRRFLGKALDRAPASR
ncbi:hypothetical protein GCM10010302_42520 [Streptomyces polychromogenes]|uniref:Uncharacterized protein n=1 Tax=Streptomyces polychromogenes TaxID=67342 RepID=A0ABN0VH24_9ACTN